MLSCSDSWRDLFGGEKAEEGIAGIKKRQNEVIFWEEACIHDFGPGRPNLAEW